MLSVAYPECQKFIKLNVVTMRVIMLNLSVTNMLIMLNVVMLNVVMLSVVMLNVVMLSVVLLNVVMLGVVAPNIGICLKLEVERSTKSYITMPCKVLVLRNFVNLALHQFDVSST
jgi:hypothetical protein